MNATVVSTATMTTSATVTDSGTNGGNGVELQQRRTLEAEIARIEAEVRRAQLEQEIRAAEQALALQMQQQQRQQPIMRSPTTAKRVTNPQRDVPASSPLEYQPIINGKTLTSTATTTSPVGRQESTDNSMYSSGTKTTEALTQSASDLISTEICKGSWEYVGDEDEVTEEIIFDDDDAELEMDIRTAATTTTTTTKTPMGKSSVAFSVKNTNDAVGGVLAPVPVSPTSQRRVAPPPTSPTTPVSSKQTQSPHRAVTKTVTTRDNGMGDPLKKVGDSRSGNHEDRSVALQKSQQELELEEEIRKMQAEIEARKARRKSPRKKRLPDNLVVARDHRTTDSVSSDLGSMVSMESIERERLEEEIRRMEAEIEVARRAQNAGKIATSPPQSPPPSSLAPPKKTAKDIERERLDEEIRRIEAEILASQSVANSSSSRSPETGKVRSPIGNASLHTIPETPSSNNVSGTRPAFLLSIADAAANRERRMEENDGIPFMQDIKPEVEVKQSTYPQLSFALAEMITKKAREREERIASGGERRFRKVKQLPNYRAQFSNVATEAAALGRLTRLKEHSVEAVGSEKEAEEEWRSKGLLAIQWRRTHMDIIQEAAALGNQTKMREQVVINGEVEEEADWEEEYLEEEPLPPRLKELLELSVQAGKGHDKVDTLIAGLREEKVITGNHIIHPMTEYTDVSEVILPINEPPKFDVEKHRRRVEKMKEEAEREHRPMRDIGKDVAQIAWERRTRLNRPGCMPKVTEKCDCPYCGTASPYQTFAYRLVELHMKCEERRVRRSKIHAIGDDMLCQELDGEYDHDEEQVTELQDEMPMEQVQPTSAAEKLKQRLGKSGDDAPSASMANLEPKPPTATESKQVVIPPKQIAKPVPTSKASSPPPPPVNQGCACIIL